MTGVWPCVWLPHLIAVGALDVLEPAVAEVLDHHLPVEQALAPGVEARQRHAEALIATVLRQILPLKLGGAGRVSACHPSF